MHGSGLGDLQHQGRLPGVPLAHQLQQIRAHQVVGGHVNGKRWRHALAQPDRRIAPRTAHYLAGQPLALLAGEQRQEMGRADQAQGGVLPAHQRLDAAEPPAAELELGLIVDGKLIALQRSDGLLDGEEGLAPHFARRYRSRAQVVEAAAQLDQAHGLLQAAQHLQAQGMT